MKIIRITVLLFILTALLMQTCYCFTVELKEGQRGHGTPGPKGSPSPGTYIPAPENNEPAPVNKPTEEVRESVKNPMEIDMEHAKTPPPTVKTVEDPPPPNNNMPIILGSVAGVIVLGGIIGFVLHKKNSNQEF